METDRDNSIRIVASINALAEFYEKSLSGIQLDFYVGALEGFTPEQVDAASRLAVKTLKFFPKPAELIELIQGSPDDQAAQAWETLWNAYLKAGFWDSVLFQDGAIARTVALIFGGWIAFSETMRAFSPEMIQAKRKEFLATYRRESRQPKEPMRLAGHHEVENLNKVSTWTKDQFSDTYKQRVFIAQTSGSRFVDAHFHRNSAQMIESDMDLLEEARFPALQARPALQLMPKPSDEARAMKPEDVRAKVQSLIKSVKMR